MTDLWSTREATPMNPTVVIQETSVEVRAGDPFASKVKEIADGRGVKNFKVYLNGAEVGQGDAPASFRSGDEVKIVPYDKAA